MKTVAFKSTSSLFLLIFSLSADAALLSRLNGQAYYDTVLDITWLADANLAASNTFGVSGIDTEGGMIWDTAHEWINAMNASTYLGFSDWRLPSVMPLNGVNYTSAIDNWEGTGDIMSFNVSAPGTLYEGSIASEMAHLNFNTLGTLAIYDIYGNYGQSGWGLNNTGPFSDLQNNYHFGNEYDAQNSWLFLFDVGFQGIGYKDNVMHAWAVMDGDVAVVPLPSSLWLFFSGILFLSGVRKNYRVCCQ